MVESATYRGAGVDIDAGDALVGRLKPLAASTRRAGVLGGLGGFGALFDIKACGMRDPLLVAATDGVGTKLKIAQATGRHDTIGIDLVAMCVNDLIVQAAEPLFFLDYFATGALSVDVAERVIAGIAEGCRQAGCALVGGETAEMPSLYVAGEYDLAGFAVGAVERDALLPRPDVRAGDVVLGLSASGLHSNGYSLVRHLVERGGHDYARSCPFDAARSLGEALLNPTRIYVKSALAAIRHGGVKALAHITGGGLIENIPRVLPEGVAAHLARSAWEVPPVFSWLQREGRIEEREMWRTFNCGIGMVMVVESARAGEVSALLAAEGERVYTLGEIRAREHEAVVIG